MARAESMRDVVDPVGIRLEVGDECPQVRMELLPPRETFGTHHQKHYHGSKEAERGTRTVLVASGPGLEDMDIFTIRHQSKQHGGEYRICFTSSYP